MLGRNEGEPEGGAVRTQAQQVQRHQEGVLRHIFSLEQVGMSQGGAQWNTFTGAISDAY